jgi:TctA family transporter
MELFLVLVLAIFVGILAGLLPGIGAGMVIISAYPILQKCDINTIFFFYIVLITTMQYYGSISSIIFGVMGEPTSQPAVDNGHELFRRGLGDKTLATTATSSFIASLFGVLVFCVCAKYSTFLIMFLSAIFKVSILTSVLVLLVATNKNKLFGIVLLILGLVFGSAGSEIVPWINQVFPKYSVFDGGIPFSALLTGFIVIPTLLSYSLESRTIPVFDSTNLKISFKSRIKNLFDFSYFTSTLRGSIVGCVAGIIPGVSYTISSNLAEMIEKFLNKKSNTNEALTKNILSAEAANNAGSIVVLIPLLLFAIPIVPSEALIMSLVQANGFNYLTGLSFISKHFVIITFLLVFVNLINWFISGYCYKFIIDLYKFLGKYGYTLTLIGCTIIVLITGYNDNQFLYTTYVLLISTICGSLIKDTGTKMIFVFSFFVASDLVPDFYRLYLTYF